MHQGFSHIGIHHKHKHKGHFNPNQQYVIQSALDHSMVMTVGNGQPKDTKVKVTKNQSFEHQKFHFLQNNNRFLIISSLGQTLEIPNASKDMGTQIWGSNRTQSMNQVWQLVPAKHDGVFFIKCFNNLCLDAEGGKVNPGTHVIQWEHNGGKNQKWVIEPVKYKKRFDTDHYYQIVSAMDKSMLLTILKPEDHTSPNHNKMVIMERDKQPKHHMFKIYQNDYGYCDLVYEDKSIHVPDNSGNDGAHLKFFNMNENPQKCRFIPVKDTPHAFYIRTFCGKVLDIQGGKATNKTSVIQWHQHNGQNQIWYIQPIKEHHDKHHEKHHDKHHDKTHEKHHDKHHHKLFNPKQAYHIVTALNKQMCLTVWQAKDPKNVDKLILKQTSQGTDNQKFHVVELENGEFELICQGKSLHVPGDTQNNGIQLKFIEHPNNKQKCKIKPIKDYPNAYKIKTFCGKVLDVEGNKTDPKTPVIQWDDNKTNNQMWYFQPV